MEHHDDGQAQFMTEFVPDNLAFAAGFALARKTNGNRGLAVAAAVPYGWFGGRIFMQGFDSFTPNRNVPVTVKGVSRDEIIQLYQNGNSCKAIAQMSGFPVEEVTSVVRASGLLRERSAVAR